jgi:hypothetical protein
MNVSAENMKSHMKYGKRKGVSASEAKYIIINYSSDMSVKTSEIKTNLAFVAYQNVIKIYHDFF